MQKYTFLRYSFQQTPLPCTRQGFSITGFFCATQKWLHEDRNRQRTVNSRQRFMFLDVGYQRHCVHDKPAVESLQDKAFGVSVAVHFQTVAVGSECKNTKKSRYNFRNSIFFIKTEPLSAFFLILCGVIQNFRGSDSAKKVFFWFIVSPTSSSRFGFQ